jgi:hypothetical protein
MRWTLIMNCSCLFAFLPLQIGFGYRQETKSPFKLDEGGVYDILAVLWAGGTVKDSHGVTCCLSTSCAYFAFEDLDPSLRKLARSCLFISITAIGVFMFYFTFDVTTDPKCMVCWQGPSPSLEANLHPLLLDNWRNCYAMCPRNAPALA